MKKLLLYFTILTFGIGYSQNIFHDDISSYSAGTDLNGNGNWTNNSSSAGTGACTGVLCTNSQIFTKNMSYTNYGSTTKCLTLAPDLDGCGHLFTPVTTGDMYVGFVCNISSSVTSPNDFFRVCSGNSLNTTFRIFIKTVTSNSFSIGISKGASGNAVAYTNSSYGFNQDHLIILKYTQSSGAADDVLNLYVDPVMANGVPSLADATTSSGTDQAGNVDRMVFRQNATNTPSGFASLVSVAQSWTGLIFSNLTSTEFQKESFVVNTNEVQSGNLSIQSKQNLSNATLKIYNLEGKTIENRTISLSENWNSVIINPIQNSGIYIIEITSNEINYNQKFIVK